MAVWSEGGSLLERLRHDAEVTALVPAEKLAPLFDEGWHTRHVEMIFERAFRD